MSDEYERLEKRAKQLNDAIWGSSDDDSDDSSDE